MYRFDPDEEEYYLDCYDEMHNHVLCSEPRIMPLVKKNTKKPAYETPSFFKFESLTAPDFEGLKAQIV